MKNPELHKGKKEWIQVYLHRAVSVFHLKIKQSIKLIDTFEEASNIDDRDKSKVIEIDNALYDIEMELNMLYAHVKSVRETLVGKKSSYKNSLYNMDDYNESNEHFINIGDV